MPARTMSDESSADAFSVRVLRTGAGQVHVVVSGAVDALSRDELMGVVTDVWTDPPARLVLDLRRVTFFSLSSLRIVLTARDRARARRVTFEVLTRTGAVRRLLARLDQLA